jgi:hypothetical protein
MPDTNENLEFGMDGAKIVLTIGGHDYPLVAGPLAIHIPGTLKDPKLKFQFRYKESAETPAIVLGTPREVINSLQAMFTSAELPLPAGVQKFEEQWNAIIGQLRSFPFFDQAIDTFESTSARIDEIGLELAPKGDFYEGQFRFGLCLTPAESKRPRLFNVEVKEFGATLYVSVTIAKTRLARFGR